ncbi:hypothetical protein [Actinokineospora iranica]|uniref:Uncharacterized protein n=1 Tax=Actinokineospora iranica TaxID=1271860 RepID=A0A1G6LGV4_9PSEU|nr:hypothetical protein [Actinokineospora iranica]SDC42434.1 hypothetical protein SAMN05216174_10265 [Actinokineospora iranica]
MSFDELMTHAAAIQQKAVKRAVTNKEADPEYARGGVEGYYRDIPDLFRPFAEMPNPAAYDPLIHDLQVVLQKLSTGHVKEPANGEIYLANVALANMTTASDYLEDWTGKAAVAFKQNFLDTFPPIVENQFILVSVLKAALEAHKSMWAKARDDVDKIAHTTMDALDNAACCDKNAWTVGFTVVASVSAVAATLVSGGTAAPLAFTAVGATAQVIAATPPPETDKQYAGETAVQITNAMKEALRALADSVQEVETIGHKDTPGIAPALRAAGDLVGQYRASFVANRPELADGRGKPLTGPDQMGEVS